MMPTYNVLDIRRGTTVDGPGLRTSIYLAGCRHACKGCHNPDSWPATAGQPMTLEEIMAVIREEDFDVTLTGGDPLMHTTDILPLMQAIRDEGKSIWLFTGYTIEEIRRSPRLRHRAMMADAVVEGPFVAELRDPDLQFRGSSNQRIIHIPHRAPAD